MKEEYLEKFASLVIKRGINVQNGEKLLVTFNSEFAKVAVKLAVCAYNNGAKLVKLDMRDKEMQRAAYSNLSIEDLKYIPEFDISRAHEFIKEDYSHISLSDTVQFDTLKDVDSLKMREVAKYRGQKFDFLDEHLMRGLSKWCVVCYPSSEWAEKIFGSDGNASQKMDELFIKIMRLDLDDPIAYWDEHCLKLGNLAQKLTELKLEYIHITNNSTDLKVYINKSSIWLGGSEKRSSGLIYMPNIPTEEVFTTPDFRKTEGFVKVIRPVMVFGNLVKDAYFEFKNGKVVKFDASEGKKFLEKFLEVDEGSSMLGEIALVDCNSPIYKSKMIFSNILFDENAACHMALGAGYPSCIKDADNLKTKEDLLNAGCNDSFNHTDFMIGTEDTNIDGFTFDNLRIPIFRDGHFVI